MKTFLIQMMAVLAIIYEIGVLIYAGWVLYWFHKEGKDERDNLYGTACCGMRMCDYDHSLRDPVYQDSKGGCEV